MAQVFDQNLGNGVGGWVTQAAKGAQGAQFAPGIGYYYPPGYTPPTVNTPTVPMSNTTSSAMPAYPAATPQLMGNYNLPGVGYGNVYQTPGGMDYYTMGGKNYALTSQEEQKLGIPQIVGYNQSGQPYYYNPPANQPTPEKAALQQLYKTDPGLRPMINNLQSYYNGLGKATKTGTLDPATLNEVTQAADAAQVARGNALGTAQASQQAMTTGLTGWEMGQQNAQNIASYLNSGTTPAAMGARELGDIINQGQSANNSTPFQSTYNPAGTFTYTSPNAGQNFSSGANNWYNGMNYQYLGSGAAGGGMNPMGSALSGAASGAGTGAMIGSVFPGYGTLIGAGIGALAGGIGGYGAGGGFCWVAQEVYGKDNPKWRVFRHWLLNEAPERLLKAYSIHGEAYAKYISDKPELKNKLQTFMDKCIRFVTKEYAHAG